MRNLQKLIPLSALVFTVGVVSEPLLRTLNGNPAQAQSAASPTPFPLPASLPSGTTVKVDGSSSMNVANESLKQRFAEKFPGTTLDFATNGSDEAMKALEAGQANVAAVGRPLTA
jgi:phosphate transport system substrate-binding protein